MSSKTQALARILHEAGLTWSSADEVQSAIDRVSICGAGSDDVAALLLAWRRSAVRSRLAGCRRAAQEMLNKGGNGHNNLQHFQEGAHGDPPFDADDCHQLTMFDDVVTTMARVGALAKCAAAALDAESKRVEAELYSDLKIVPETSRCRGGDPGDRLTTDTR